MKFLLMLTVAAAWAQEAPSFANEGVVNAPMAEVWKVFSTSAGYTALGVALAEVDLRIGGAIRSRYGSDGQLGDEETIENLIMAYEPPRMMAMRIQRTPKTFPFKQAWKTPWTVVTLTDVGGNRTHVRVASMGFGPDEESLAMRRFFERGNQEVIETLQRHFAGRAQ